MDNYETWLQALRTELAAATVKAEPLVEQGRFDDAEQLLRVVNSDIYGAVALGELFTKALERAVQRPQPDRAKVQTLYERALRWRSAWPEIHTASEARKRESHISDVRKELAALLSTLPLI